MLGGIGYLGRLYLIVLAVSIIYICTGCVFTWTSPVFPKLKLSVNDESWVSSLFSLGAAAGPIITGLALDRLGRKGTLFVVVSCFIVSWIILASSTLPYILYIGRVIGGMGVGSSFPSVSVYVAEISDDKHRNILCSLTQIFIGIGSLLELSVGPFIDYLPLAIISGAVPVCIFVLLFFIPESPYHLLNRGKSEEALNVLALVRPSNEHELGKELESIHRQVKIEGQLEGSTFKLLTTTAVRNGLIISIFLMFMLQGCCFNGVSAVLQNIFDMANIQMSSDLSSVILGISNVVGSIPTPYLVFKFGMRNVLLGSALAMGIFECLLASFFLLQSYNLDVSYLGFVPVVTLMLYTFSYCIGLGALPWAIVVQLFRPEIKGTACAICGVFSWLIGFAGVKLFTWLVQGDSPGMVFLGFGIFMIICSVVLPLIVPDNSGLSLSEIQELLSGDKY